MPLLLAPVPAIAPEPPAASILTAARLLPVPFDDAPGQRGWRSGINWQPNGCSSIHGWSDCDDLGRPVEKCDPTIADVVQVRPWIIYAVDGCDNLPSGDLNFNERATQVMEAYQPAAVARELATGEFGSGTNPSLESTAALADPSEPLPLNVQNTISLLLEARENAGFFGMTTVAIPSWLIPGGDNAYLFTNVGTVNGLGMLRIAPGPGFPGRSPASAAVPNAAPATGTGWIYALGTVEYGLGPIQTPMTRENQRVRTNQASYIAERPAIVRFDPCGVFAALAKIGA